MLWLIMANLATLYENFTNHLWHSALIKPFIVNLLKSAILIHIVKLTS